MNEEQMQHLMRNVQADSLYQDFLRMHGIFKPLVEQILSALPPQEQSDIYLYLQIQQAMADRTACCAYFLQPLPEEMV